MNTSETRTCQNCRENFAIEPADFDFYTRINVPPPTFCPDCRQQRRMSFRNERNLYKDICDLCSKTFVSMFSPDKTFKVYCKECWYSDKWDGFQYGREYDWNKPFVEQFRELLKSAPQIGIVHIHNNINCDYANYTADSKNAYLSQSVIAGSENVYYSRNIDGSKEIFDCFALKESEQCYENVDGSRNYKCKFMYRSRDCINSAFLFDCVNCQNCFMSSSLRNKQFVIRNKEYSKEGYAAELKNINLGKETELRTYKKEFGLLIAGSLHKFGNLVKVENCTGNNVENSKNAKWSFDTYGAENIKFCSRAPRTKDSYDLLGAGDGELLYEIIYSGYESYNSQFLFFGEATVDSRYVNGCLDSSNMLGCVSLRKKQYCILNKQYTQEEYETLVPKIIEHMNKMPYIDKGGREYRYGEFFPAEISLFAYNETIAQEYFPLTKEQAIERGYAWRKVNPSPHKPTITPENLPDDIATADDSITKEIIGCRECGRAYRILKAELEFLKQHSIALPRLCPECRHKARFNLRNPLRLWHRKCACLFAETLAKAGTDGYKNTSTHFHGKDTCPNEFETSYAPDRPETVYCEQCYNAEIV